MFKSRLIRPEDTLSAAQAWDVEERDERDEIEMIGGERADD